MDSITKTTLSIVPTSEFLDLIYESCEQIPLGEVRHTIQQYHGCQEHDGSCMLCPQLKEHYDPVQRCTETLEQGHMFAEDCIDILNYIEEEGFLTEDEWNKRQYLSLDETHSYTRNAHSCVGGELP